MDHEVGGGRRVSGLPRVAPMQFGNSQALNYQLLRACSYMLAVVGWVRAPAAPVPGPSDCRRLTVSMPYITGSPNGWRRSQESPMYARRLSHDSPGRPATVALNKRGILALPTPALAVRDTRRLRWCGCSTRTCAGRRMSRMGLACSGLLQLFLDGAELFEGFFEVFDDLGGE